MNDHTIETRPEHQRVFPTYVIDQTVEYAQHNYRAHFAGQRWALETGFALLRAGRIEPDLLKDTLLAVMESIHVSSALSVMSSTLRDFNSAKTTEEFVHNFGKVILEVLDEKSATNRMYTMLEHLRVEQLKFEQERTPE